MTVYPRCLVRHYSLLYFLPRHPLSFFFFFNDTATTEIYTLSLHDALPISTRRSRLSSRPATSSHTMARVGGTVWPSRAESDRKSTRLNSSHLVISYAVFCLKKKKIKKLSDSHSRHICKRTLAAV